MTELLPHLRESATRRRIIAEDVDAVLTASLPWKDLCDKTVLVTGAGGFLAAYVIETLLGMRARLGFGPCKVIGLVRSRQRARMRFAFHGETGLLELIEGDVADHNLQIESQIDFIIHAASPASPRAYLTDPVGVLDANLLGTRAMLALALAKKSRFLFISSGEVYGEPAVVPTGETDFGFLDPATTRACYGESKRAAETMCVAWAHQFGLHTTILRPFHTYGPGVALDDGRVFADFISDILAGRDIVMRSDGSAIRAFCYISDFIEGLFTVLFKGQSGSAYNVGNEDAEISIAKLAEVLVGIFPELNLKVIKNLDDRGFDYAVSKITRNVPNIALMRSLGWTPKTGIPEGFRRMVSSYK